MPYPLVPLAPDTPGYPAGPKELGPNRPVLFHTMPLEGMSACLAAGRLLSTRDCLARPEIRVLGMKASVRARLTMTVCPFLGVVADAVPFSLTPHTRAVFGSCGPVLQPGTERVRRDEIVVAILRLDTLRSVGVPLSPATGARPVRMRCSSRSSRSKHCYGIGSARISLPDAMWTRKNSFGTAAGSWRGWASRSGLFRISPSRTRTLPTG